MNPPRRRYITRVVGTASALSVFLNRIAPSRLRAFALNLRSLLTTQHSALSTILHPLRPLCSLWFNLLFFLLPLSFLFLVSCTGLSTEPRVVSTLIPPTAAPTELGYPVQPPDLVRGAQIYAANCTRCHGETGAGDGELVLTGQVQNVASFTDPATAFSQRPSDWHATITNGNIENLMPPWRDALTEQERWDVAFYTYTLSYTADHIERGQAIYADKCAECHGETGIGDGERAAEIDGDVSNLQNQPSMVILSDQAMYNIVNEGVGEAMPAFGDELSPDDITAVARYARTLSLSSPQVIAQSPAVAQATDAVSPPAAAEETSVNIAPTTGSITGSIINGTGGGTIPDSITVTLFIFSETAAPQQISTTSSADGSFRFDDVTLDPTSQYITTTLYRDRIFTSGLFMPDAGVTTLDLPVTIYELTEDPAVVEISGIVSQVNAIGDNLEVAQVFSFRNTSDRAFTTNQATTNGQPISIVISLPPGAIVTGLGGGQNRYVVLSEQFLVVDTTPVLPGEEHLVQIVYLIPYNGSAIVEQPMQYPVNGPVRLLMNPIQTRVQSAQLPLIGIETLGQTQYQSYGATLNLAAGDVIRYDVSGDALNASQRDLISSSNLPVIIVIVIVGEIILIAALYLWYRQRRTARAASPDLPRGGTRTDPNLIDALVRQIAELDAAHEQGEVDDESYKTQRAALKGRLADLMTKK